MYVTKGESAWVLQSSKERKSEQKVVMGTNIEKRRG